MHTNYTILYFCYRPTLLPNEQSMRNSDFGVILCGHFCYAFADQST